SLATIDQIAAPFVLDEQCREPALRAGYARRRPEEGGLQHRGTPRSGPPRRPSRLAAAEKPLDLRQLAAQPLEGIGNPLKRLLLVLLGPRRAWLSQEATRWRRGHVVGFDHGISRDISVARPTNGTRLRLPLFQRDADASAIRGD